MPRANPDFEFLTGHVEAVARRLLGCLLIRDIDGEQLIVRIVETEAYHETDAASHSYKGVTPRTQVMFGPAGHLYVYFTYGMHFCCNIVTGPEGEGSAVLIRAAEPVQGHSTMTVNRHGKSGVELTNGPAKLCQALRIDRAANGFDLKQSPIRLSLEAAVPDEQIIQTTRIGISKAKDTAWRFYIAGNRHVSAL